MKPSINSTSAAAHAARARSASAAVLEFICERPGSVQIAARLEVARSIWEEGLSRVTEVTQRHHYPVPLIIDLGRLAAERGDKEAAASLLVEALTSADERSRWQLAHALEAAVEMLAAENHLT